MLHRPLARFLAGFFDLEARFFLLQPRRVVAFPRNAVAAVEFENPAGDVVEEVAIMGHGDDRARVFVEEALEPRDRLGIEVVGRFVEQQHVGLRQQQATQCDTAAFAARQLGDVRVPGRQAQCVSRNLEFAIDFPAAGRVDGILQLALFVEQSAHFVVDIGSANFSLISLKRCKCR